MLPQEINKLTQQSDLLSRSLKMRNTYTFLRREEVAICCSNDTCEKCNKLNEALLISPYNGSFPGWCVDCILHAFFADEPLYDKYRDPRSKYYDTVYGKQYRTWNDFELEFGSDYDGPPIAWG